MTTTLALTVWDALAELLLNEECKVAKLELKQCNVVDSVLKDFYM